MKGLPPPLPPRPRAISQPDAEVPESVYQALHGVQQSVQALSQTVATGQAAMGSRLDGQDKALAELKASSADRWVNLAKIIVPAVVSIIGAQRLLAPTPPPAEVRAVRSQADLDLDECRPLQPGSYERAECFERVSRGPAHPKR